MKPVAFRYHKVKTVKEAVAALGEFAPDDGRVLAGGQSLVPTMAFRLARPGHLVDINGVEGLDRLAVDGDVLSIGACVRHGAFHKPVVEGPLGLLLAQIVSNIAHYPIRQRGTFCGSLAHSDPASEWCLTATTLDAELVAMSTQGTRTIATPDFFEGVMTTSLEPDELLAEARLPLLADDTKFGFIEFNRRAGDFAIGAVLTTWRLEGGVIVDAHLGVGGAEDRPRRIAEAEQALNGSVPGPDVFQAAADAAAQAVDPMSDHTTSADYRRDLVGTLAFRALESSAA